MGEEKDLLTGLIQELRRGTLILSVLSQMGQPKYGYALVQSLEKQGIAIDPNTLYPLLRRLEKQGLLRSEWEMGGIQTQEILPEDASWGQNLWRIKKAVAGNGFWNGKIIGGGMNGWMIKTES